MSDQKNIKRVKGKVEEILNSNKTKQGETDYTHVSLGGQCFPGKFTISDHKVRSKLMKYVAELHDKGVYLSIAERPKDYGPVKVDVDLNYPEEEFKESTIFSNNRLYNSDMVSCVLELYKKHIKFYCDINDKDLNCYLFEKKNYSVKNSEIKDGFHLIFPNINLHYKIRHLIVEKVIKDVSQMNMFNKYTNADIIDRAVVSSNCWLLYGCCKPNKEPYVLAKHYNYQNNEMNLNDLGTTRDIIKEISLRDQKWSDSKQTKLNESYNDNIISEAYSELGVKKEKANTHDVFMTEEKSEEIEKSVKLSEFLSHKRADNYHSCVIKIHLI